MKRYIYVSFIIMLNMISSSGVAQSIEYKIAEVLLPYVEHQIFSGAILVAKNRKIVYQRGYAKASREWDIFNEPRVKYGLGSITKTFTAVTVMKLLQEDKVQLDDSVSKYIPELNRDKFQSITLHHLLSHTSGLPNYFELEGWTDGVFNRLVSPHEFIEVIENMKLNSVPGKQYLYSNAGYYLLGEVIERVTGKTYSQALEKLVLSPLQMNDTGRHLPEKLISHRASGYRWASDGFKNQGYINISLFKAAGDLYSTVLDLYKFDQAFYGEKLLSKKSKSTMFSPDRSYGWSLESWSLGEGAKLVNTQAYAGQLQGFSSMLTRFPDEGHSIIILSNTGTSYFERRRITESIAAVLYGVPLAKKMLPATFVLSKALARGELKQAIEELKKNAKQYRIEEARINSLATQLLWSGTKELAIEVLTLNTALFPDSKRASAVLTDVLRGN